MALFASSKMLMLSPDKIKTQFIKTGADKIFETLPNLGILVYHFPVFS